MLIDFETSNGINKITKKLKLKSTNILKKIARLDVTP
jgi:hypothetical protein